MLEDVSIMIISIRCILKLLWFIQFMQYNGFLIIKGQLTEEVVSFSKIALQKVILDKFGGYLLK